MEHQYVYAYVLDVPLHADIPYTYFLTPELRGRVTPGTFVTVPFGAANRHRAAVVSAFAEPPENETIKPVLAVLNDRFSLSEELLGLCLFMKEHTLCTFGDAARTVVPASGLALKTDSYSIAGEWTERKRTSIANRYGNVPLYVYTFIEQRGTVSSARLRAEFGDSLSDALAALTREKLIRRESRIRSAEHESYANYLSPARDEETLRAIAEDAPQAEIRLRSVGQRAILSAGGLLNYTRANG